VFEHSPLAQASALDRKKKRDELTIKHVSLCPGGMSACAIPGIDGAYEVNLSESERKTRADDSASIHRVSWNRVAVACTERSMVMGRWITLLLDQSKSDIL